jgi:hypothetical protein
MLVAGRVGIVTAAWRIVSPGGRGSDCSSADTYRYSATYGRTTINASAIGATVMDAGATNAGTSSICEGVCCYRRNAGDADNDGSGNGDNASM